MNSGFMSWSGAKQACERSTSGSHLANMKTDAEFLSIISFLESYNHLLLLWTALNDHEVHGARTWTLWRLLHTFYCGILKLFKIVRAMLVISFSLCF